MGVKFFRGEKKTAHFKHNGRTFKDPKKIRPAGYARNKASRLCRKQVNRICVNGAKKKTKGSEEAGTRSVILLSNLEQLISFKQ